MAIPTMLMAGASLVSVLVVAWMAMTGRLGLGRGGELMVGGAGRHCLAEDRADQAMGGVLLLGCAALGMALTSVGVWVAMAAMGLGGRVPEGWTLREGAVVQIGALVAGAAGVLAIGWAWPVGGVALGRWSVGVSEWARGMVACVVVLPLVWGVGAGSAVVYRVVRGEPPPGIAHSTLARMVEAPLDVGWWLMVGAVVVGAPVFEELLHRGLVLGGVRRIAESWVTRRDASGGRGASAAGWMAIAVSSVLFALVHLGVAAWVAMPSLLALGLCLGWLRVRSGGLLAPVVVHAAFNAMNIVLAHWLVRAA